MIYMGPNYSFKLGILYLIFILICTFAFSVVHKPQPISLISKSPSARVQFFIFFPQDMHTDPSK